MSSRISCDSPSSSGTEYHSRFSLWSDGRPSGSHSFNLSTEAVVLDDPYQFPQRPDPFFALSHQNKLIKTLYSTLVERERLEREYCLKLKSVAESLEASCSEFKGGDASSALEDLVMSFHATLTEELKTKVQRMNRVRPLIKKLDTSLADYDKASLGLDISVSSLRREEEKKYSQLPSLMDAASVALPSSLRNGRMAQLPRADSVFREALWTINRCRLRVRGFKTYTIVGAHLGVLESLKSVLTHHGAHSNCFYVDMVPSTLAFRNAVENFSTLDAMEPIQESFDALSLSSKLDPLPYFTTSTIYESQKPRFPLIGVPPSKDEYCFLTQILRGLDQRREVGSRAHLKALQMGDSVYGWDGKDLIFDLETRWNHDPDTLVSLLTQYSPFQLGQMFLVCLMCLPKPVLRVKIDYAQRFNELFGLPRHLMRDAVFHMMSTDEKDTLSRCLEALVDMIGDTTEVWNNIGVLLSQRHQKVYADVARGIWLKWDFVADAPRQ
ncbi:hypothetical protein FRC14_002245 [Serendipita sp. 396]|nr:hypothetical protein FRC14_002245 [Serendipita sp. 396]KAG8784910.1 hypothetical protein FRC15_002354 [Serendipita sp. 397]